MHAFWDQEKLFDEKAGDEKSLDAVLLTVKITRIRSRNKCKVGAVSGKNIWIHNTATLLELLCEVQTSVLKIEFFFSTENVISK